MNIIKDFIPVTNINRPNRHNSCLSITIHNAGTQAVAMGLQARAIEAQVSNTEADTALKIAQATKKQVS